MANFGFTDKITDGRTIHVTAMKYVDKLLIYTDQSPFFGTESALIKQTGEYGAKPP